MFHSLLKIYTKSSIIYSRMQRLQVIATAILLFTRISIILGYAFTEPPVDDPDYTKTYTLGQTVFVA